MIFHDQWKMMLIKTTLQDIISDSSSYNPYPNREAVSCGLSKAWLEDHQKWEATVLLMYQ